MQVLTRQFYEETLDTSLRSPPSTSTPVRKQASNEKEGRREGDIDLFLPPLQPQDKPGMCEGWRLLAGGWLVGWGQVCGGAGQTNSDISIYLVWPDSK